MKGNKAGGIKVDIRRKFLALQIMRAGNRPPWSLLCLRHTSSAWSEEEEHLVSPCKGSRGISSSVFSKELSRDSDIPSMAWACSVPSILPSVPAQVRHYWVTCEPEFQAVRCTFEHRGRDSQLQGIREFPSLAPRQLLPGEEGSFSPPCGFSLCSIKHMTVKPKSQSPNVTQIPPSSWQSRGHGNWKLSQWLSIVESNQWQQIISETGLHVSGAAEEGVLGTSS